MSESLVSQQKPLASKNGKVELYRFFFCIAVLLFHAQKYLMGEASLNNGIHLALFPHGSIGVEFFFILSGFLMGKSIYKIQSRSSKGFVPSEGLLFMKKKYLSIFPQHIIAFILAFSSFVIVNHYTFKRTILKAIDSVPNFFLVQMSGINFSNPNHVEWYISCMLISMALIYPICRRFYYSFTRYFAPLSALLIIGYMVYTTKSLTGVTTWTGICYKSLLRAFAEISLGTSAFELSRYISEKCQTKNKRLAITVSEIICFVFIAAFTVLTVQKKYEVYILALLFLLVALSFSSASYGTGVFNNKVCYFLGKISLPIYLAQVAAINITTHYFTQYNMIIRVSITVLITFIFACIVMLLGNLLSKILIKKK